MATSNRAKRTRHTFDGLRVYDLDPQASELWACIGPEGADPRTLDPDNLPEGFRLITPSEWEAVESGEAEIVLYSQTEHWRESHYIGRLIDSALAESDVTGEEACCDIHNSDFDDLLDDLQSDVINFLVDRGYSVYCTPLPQRHGDGVIVDQYRPEQQAIIEKALEAAVAASKPFYVARAQTLVLQLRNEAAAKQDAKRLALFDEAADLLLRTLQPIGEIPLASQLATLKTLKGDIQNFLAKVAKK